MDAEKLIALLSLKKVPNLGDSSIKKLIRELGSAEAVLKEKPKNLLKIDGMKQNGGLSQTTKFSILCMMKMNIQKN